MNKGDVARGRGVQEALILEAGSEEYMVRNSPAGDPVLKKLNENPERGPQSPGAKAVRLRKTTEIKAIQQIYVILYKYILK
ncbi:MAG: hypothetical protein LUQ32_07025 [Methanomicrobiales archaeon]|nr:hypothetical protein [Methanomicrobiales archaeon]